MAVRSGGSQAPSSQAAKVAGGAGGDVKQGHDVDVWIVMAQRLPLLLQQLDGSCSTG